MKKIGFSAIIVALVLAGDIGFLQAVDVGGKGNAKLGKITNASGLPVRTKININSISAWYDSDLVEEINSSTGNSGLDYPRGTSQAIFAAGLMYSGEFNDGNTPVIRTNGHSYNSGFVRGAILGTRTGITEDPGAADVRIWRVRRDYNTADLRLDAAEINSIAASSVSEAQIQAIRDQYATDWLEWPAAKGAPFYDADSDGMYTPVVVDGKPTLFPLADEPGLAGADQAIWYTANDIGRQSPWGSSPSAGLEVQLTVWGYARTDALGEVVFKKYRLIYKGTGVTPSDADITDMYLSQWSDPDLGSASDDFAGCDTVLSLGFVYNGSATDANYAAFPDVPAPPAMGYDFLQGPLVQGVAGQDLNKNLVDDAVDSSGVFDLKRAPTGFINLPMTSFVYFAAGGTYSDPPFDGEGALQWNCMLHGFPPTPQPPPCPVPQNDPYLVPPAPSGKYWLYAGSDGAAAPNPNSPNGWVDGMIDAPGDRRLILASGPFTMAVGDTQELVSGVVGGLGNDYLKSVEVMKFNDKSVQLAYNNLFNLPKPPPPPDMKIVALNGQLLLEWESNAEAVAATEGTEFPGGYKFEAYNVYQFPSQGATLDDGVLLGTFDLTAEEDMAAFGVSVQTIFQQEFDPESGEIISLPVQSGKNTGVSRTFTVSRDEFRSAPLVNGTPYYFAVTAYNYTADITIPLKTLESLPTITTGIPSTADPGARFPYESGDTVTTLSKTTGLDATAFATVYNPTSQTGQTYEVRFDTTVNNVLGWTLSEVGGDTLYTAVEDLTGTTPYRIVDAGVDVFVQGAPAGIISVTDEGGDAVFGPESTNPNVAVLSPDEDLASINGMGQTNRNYEIRFDGIGSWGIRIGTISHAVVRLPFSVWDVGRTGDTTAFQVVAGFVDSAAGGIANFWNVTANGVRQGGTLFKVFEPISVNSRANPNDSLALFAIRTSLVAGLTNPTNVESALFRLLIADKDNDSVGAPVGTTIRFNKYGETRGGDVMTIGLESVTSGDAAAAKDDVTLINVFPNPYYGLNTRETSSQARFVTFNHLPAQATIRIFNLAGVLVRTLVKDANSSNPTSPQHFQWNLQNENGLPVASGIYLVYMELKDAAGVDLGNKILKLAIIQEQQFLPFY